MAFSCARRVARPMARPAARPLARTVARPLARPAVRPLVDHIAAWLGTTEQVVVRQCERTRADFACFELVQRPARFDCNQFWASYAFRQLEFKIQISSVRSRTPMTA